MIRRFARPYAKAIMEVAGSPAAASVLRGEMSRFEKARAESTELQELYANPGFDYDTKAKITKAIAARLGLSELAVRVLDVLVTNRRINDLQSVTEALAGLVRQATGTVAAQVRSAHALDEKEVAELQRALEKRAGQKVELEVSTDPELIGGFVARIGSTVYDASVAGKMGKFRESLR